MIDLVCVGDIHASISLLKYRVSVTHAIMLVVYHLSHLFFHAYLAAASVNQVHICTDHQLTAESKTTSPCNAHHITPKVSCSFGSSMRLLTFAASPATWSTRRSIEFQEATMCIRLAFHGVKRSQKPF
jgi:hypothetical protein